MNRTSTTLVLGVLALGAFTARATTPALPAAASSASWTFTPGFVSQYMFRGIRLDGASFQPSFEYDYDTLALGVWSSFPIRSDKAPRQPNPELDFYGSYGFDVVKDSLNLQPGYTIYTYPRAKRSDGFDQVTLEPSLAANYTIGALTLTPKIYYDFILKGPTAELNAACAVPLKDVGTELDFAATVGTYEWKSSAPDQGADLKNWGNYWLVGVSVPFQLMTPGRKLTVGISYTQGSDSFFKLGLTPRTVNADAMGRTVFNISYAITF